MSDHAQDRGRLAEAMGWKWRYIGFECAWEKPDGGLAGIFDPFTDADDDYAVLEWMRNGEADQKYKLSVWSDFKAEISATHDTDGCSAYEIGDYARAALKVIDNG